MKLAILTVFIFLSTLVFGKSADSVYVSQVVLNDTAKTGEEEYVIAPADEQCAIALYKINETNNMLSNYGMALRKAYRFQKIGLILVVSGSLVAVLVLPIGAAILIGGSIVSLVGTIKVWESGNLLRVKTIE